MTPTTEPIATYTVLRPFRHENRYETASWYQTVEVAPGEFTMTGEFTPDGHLTSTFYPTLPGTIVDAFFPSSFGGVMYGSGSRPEQINRPGELRGGMGYGYALAGEMAKSADGRSCEAHGGAVRIELLPGFRVVETSRYESQQWDDGRKAYVPVERILWGIERAPVEAPAAPAAR